MYSFISFSVIATWFIWDPFCITLFIFITMPRDIAAISERNEAFQGLLPDPRSNRRACGQSRELKLFISVPLRDPEHKQALSACCCPDFCQSAELSSVFKGLFSKWCASCVEHRGPLFVADKCDAQEKRVSFQDNGLQSIADQNRFPDYYEGFFFIIKWIIFPFSHFTD